MPLNKEIEPDQLIMSSFSKIAINIWRDNSEFWNQNFNPFTQTDHFF